MKHKTKINAVVGSQELVITREFELPIELLFKAYTEPELLEQWMGTKVVKLENRNHGSYQFETSHNGTVVFKANGTIHKIQPDQRIIRTFEIEGAPIGVQLEFLEFEELAKDKSKLTIQIIYKSENHRAAQLKMPFATGLNMAHDRLQEILSNFK